MTFKEALRADRRLILYSLGFSGTIIMVSYGMAIIVYLLNVNAFKQKFGVRAVSGDYFEASCASLAWEGDR